MANIAAASLADIERWIADVKILAALHPDTRTRTHCRRLLLFLRSAQLRVLMAERSPP